MHGIVFNQLFKFIRENHGQKALDEVMNNSGIGVKFYDATKAHPDEELEKILSSACEKLKISRNTALEAFGEFIAPGLLQIYGSFIKKEWDAMDLLENIETTIHKTVRISNPEADPPALQIERMSKNSLKIFYSSKRNMLHLGIGIIRAIGAHFETKIDISKRSEDGKEVIVVNRI